MLARQLENSEKIDSEKDSESDGDQENMKQREHMQTLKKRTDVLGFDRESVMKISSIFGLHHFSVFNFHLVFIFISLVFTFWRSQPGCSTL